MKKSLKYYLIIWICFLALFNVIAFVTPETFSNLKNYSKFEGGFWPCYIAITFAFILHLISSISCFSYKDKWNRSSKIALLILSSIELVIFLVIGVGLMFIPFKEWAAIIICVSYIVFAVALYLVVKAVSEHSDRVNNRKNE